MARPRLRRGSPPEEGLSWPRGLKDRPRGWAALTPVSGTGRGGAGHQRAVSEVPPQARRAHELPVLHAAGRGKSGRLGRGLWQAGLDPPVSWLASGARSPFGPSSAGSADTAQPLWLQS